MDTPRYRAHFLAEGHERLAEMGRLLPAVSAASPPTEALLRHAHTLKSMAAAMGYEPVVALAHSIEDLVDGIAVRRQAANAPPPASVVQALERGVGGLHVQLRSVAAGDPPGFQPELLVELAAAHSAVFAGLPPDAAARPRVLPPHPAGAPLTAREARGVAARAAAGGIDAVATPLASGVAAVAGPPQRLVMLAGRYPRLVQMLCQALGKQAAFALHGGELYLQAAALAALDVLVVQALRNAVDHGIETPAQRMARGKPPRGEIVLTLAVTAAAVTLTLSDDGTGIDGDALKSAALARGAIGAAEAAKLSTQEALYLACLPGVSTRSKVSAISGRGVGMDIVAEQLALLGGRLEIASTLGVGTTLRFVLPRSLAPADAATAA